MSAMIFGRILDAIRCDWINDSWRRLWYGKPGRHGGWQDYTTGQMAAIERELAQRPRYTLSAAPALQTPVPGPAPLPEIDWDDALLRSKAPRLYLSDADYWSEQWRELSVFATGWRAASAALRRECGLPDRPLPIQSRTIRLAA